MKKCIVTGGGGFLGSALCRALISRGIEVYSLSRGLYPELSSLGVKTIQCDISNSLLEREDLFRDACCIFHTAAHVKMWGKYQDFYNINVIGTRNVIDACKQFGVRRLVYTSSPSVIASGTHLRGVDESVPYPKKYDAFYPQTKAIAEQEVLQAHSDTLKALALRPHLIYGPGDTNLERLVVQRAQQGRLVKIGSGENLVDFSYIDDCVSAHLCAAEALFTNPHAGGRPYFISQGIPTKLWDWIDAALKRNGLAPVKRKVPASLAIHLGALMEILSKISPIPFEPPFTKFLAEEMATDHYFSIDAAKRELGYAPKKMDLLVW